MSLEFDSANQHCSAVVNGTTYRSAVIDVVITTNDATHMSEADIGGKKSADHRSGSRRPDRLQSQGPAPSHYWR